MAKKESENKVKKHFFKDFKAELKKVIWPTPKQLVNNTVAVVTIVLITAAIVFVLDVVFDMGNKYGISRLQSVVNEKYNKEENTDNTESTDNGEENSEEDNNETEGENVTENTSDTTESNSENDSPENKTTSDGEETNPEQ